MPPGAQVDGPEGDRVAVLAAGDPPTSPPPANTHPPQYAQGVIGEEVQLLHVGQANNRHELIATFQRNGRCYEIALLDVDVNADPGCGVGDRLASEPGPLSFWLVTRAGAACYRTGSGRRDDHGAVGRTPP